MDLRHRTCDVKDDAGGICPIAVQEQYVAAQNKNAEPPKQLRTLFTVQVSITLTPIKPTSTEQKSNKHVPDTHPTDRNLAHDHQKAIRTIRSR